MTTSLSPPTNTTRSGVTNMPTVIFPGIASIGNFPVYIENRNGNSNVKYKQDETLKRVYSVLGEFGIKVKHSRMHYGSFNRKVIPVVESNSKYFYIRAQRCASLYGIIRDTSDWKIETIGFKEYQVLSIEYIPLSSNSLVCRAKAMNI